MKGNWFVNDGPETRFYAAVKLVVPEGHCLGTLCVIDPKARPEGLSMGDKQNLMELGAMVVDYMVQRKKELLLGSPAHHVASAAHDLITPLTGIDLTVSSLKDDPNLTQVQKDQLENATRCVSVVKGICHDLLHSASKAKQKACCNDCPGDDDDCHHNTDNQACTGDGDSGIVKIAKLTDKISTVIEHHPKQVPVLISVSPDVPSEIVSNDLMLFRSALNLLTRACRTTKKGSIQFKISMDEIIHSEDGGGSNNRRMILFTCQDTGPSVPLDDYPKLFKKPDDCHMPDIISTTELGLHSMAQHMNHLGGNYGYRPVSTKQHGCVFWFRIPLFLPEKIPTPAANVQRANDDVPLFPSIASELRRNALNDAISSVRDTSPVERPRTALIIEDTLVVRKTMSRCLSKLGFEVTQAENGFIGLQKLKDAMYDIVFCDFRKYNISSHGRFVVH